MGGRKRVGAVVGIAAAVLAGVVLLGFGLAQGAPLPLALVCPQCAGFDHLRDRAFVQTAASTPERADIGRSLTAAIAHVESALGPLRGAPRVFVCVTEACYAKLTGRWRDTRGLSFYDAVLVLSPRRMGSVIAAHELTHIELHHRLGSDHAVPAWFDEGLATWISDDRRYLGPADAGDRCRGDPRGSLPRTKAEWIVAAGADHMLYARAACRVERWAAGHGGGGAVLQLISDLRAGRSFEQSTGLGST